ncbi:hypothetical protein QAD02_004946 [Eretmocerus hayati]|uniref:Uncharacterized protein n=1 Tax=Eretmocerus hayati TaxID=131215 RepID=A0ACC2NTQ8_9HYME|nr:hypothetical protein QAD02_004946 [Eretmocerus hayati]
MWDKNLGINCTLSELQDKEEFLSTGCPNLDKFLKGGIPRCGVTQIYGGSGTGKTQLALQLSIAAQIPSKCSKDVGGTAYICTESVFPSKRLYELCEKSPISQKCSISKDIIFIEHVTDTDDLESCILDDNKLPKLLSLQNIKLVIIDSIAATYRTECGAEDLRKRARSLRKIGYGLHQLSKKHNIAVVCVNQVTAVMKNLDSSSTDEQPSLGISWATMVSTSLFMYRKFNSRFLRVEGSAYLPRKSIEYEILESGFAAKSTGS